LEWKVLLTSSVKTSKTYLKSRPKKRPTGTQYNISIYNFNAALQRLGGVDGGTATEINTN
jgi:hypothetical protein